MVVPVEDDVLGSNVVVFFEWVLCFLEVFLDLVVNEIVVVSVLESVIAVDVDSVEDSKVVLDCLVVELEVDVSSVKGSTVEGSVVVVVIIIGVVERFLVGQVGPQSSSSTTAASVVTF